MISHLRNYVIIGAALGALALAQPAQADGVVSLRIGLNIGATPVRPAFVPPPVMTTRTWVAPPVNYYQPTQFYYGGQTVVPSYSVPVYTPSPTVRQYRSTTTVYYAPPVVYQSAPVYYYQPGAVTHIPLGAASRPQPRLTFGLIGRW